MNTNKADKLTAVALTIFRLNGLLIEWGNDFCQPLGLTSARWQVLGAIALSSEPLSAPQIGTSMGITRQGIQKQINLLIDEGLILALPNPGNKRSPLYALTKQGQHSFSAIDDSWKQHVQKLSGEFTSSDLDATIQVLSALSNFYAGSPKNNS
ncbi:MarR family winged helix-turn-helix transcriptional regulator [Herbaspirillum lusitanum]|uniref:MarR family winged helix-turn-helix transcriptional regulator n=1 Tax=Herbaspirillum lusitanum TaxID=213312 RepID=UPI0002F4BC5E|nr:MarR family transcriptional regulator [Herbaspirillum lusitanum]